MYEKAAVSTKGMSALQAELEALRAENARLKAKATAKLRLAVSEKGAVSLYGLRRFPVTFYMAEWQTILAQREAIEAFIVEHAGSLASKGE